MVEPDWAALSDLDDNQLEAALLEYLDAVMAERSAEAEDALLARLPGRCSPVTSPSCQAPVTAWASWSGSTPSAVQVSWARRAAPTGVALAERLGTTVVDFPGDHGGFLAHPEQFGRVLEEVLTERT